jgi:hypothetical protein
MTILDFNFDTENIIIFHYPGFAGGKFVMNCMCLSDNMVLQRQSLAQAQIDGNFSFDDKKEYILTHMKDEDITNGGWSDIGLGCEQLFIYDDLVSVSALATRSVYMNNVYNSVEHPCINNTVRFLSSETNNKLLFSLEWHHQTQFLREFFPNAKIITFKNNAQMVNHRTSFQSIASNKVWNEISPNERVADRVADFTWDTEWLYDVSTTTDGLHELYKLFNLDGWEQAEPFIKEYYHLWCEKNHLPISVKNT